MRRTLLGLGLAATLGLAGTGVTSSPADAADWDERCECEPSYKSRYVVKERPYYTSRSYDVIIRVRPRLNDDDAYDYRHRFGHRDRYDDDDYDYRPRFRRHHHYGWRYGRKY